MSERGDVRKRRHASGAMGHLRELAQVEPHRLTASEREFIIAALPDMLAELARKDETIRELEAALVEMNEDGAGWKPVAEQAERQIRAGLALADEWDNDTGPTPVEHMLPVDYASDLRAALSGVSGPTPCRVDGCDSEALPNGACSFHQVSEIDFDFDGPTTEGASE